MTVDRVLRHEKEQGCSQIDIDSYFQDGSEDQLIESPAQELRERDWKYGKPSWQLVLDAVGDCGGKATVAEITANILEEIPHSMLEMSCQI